MRVRILSKYLLEISLDRFFAYIGLSVWLGHAALIKALVPQKVHHPDRIVIIERFDVCHSDANRAF
jgi:hypothetical protein